MIPSGYKQTKVGVVPEDWKVIRLGELFQFKNGLNKGKEFFGHGTPIVNYMDVNKNDALKVEDIKGLVSVTSNELKNHNVKKGDVFFTRTSETIDEIGLSAVILDNVKDTVFSGFILRARPINNLLDNLYKKYCFSTHMTRKEIIKKSSYTTRALTNGKFLSEVIIPLPPLKEQQKIAQILTTWDDAISKQEKLIKAKERLKKGLMQKLLSGEVRFAGFDEEWKFTKLCDLLEYEQPTKYLVANKDYDSSYKTPVLTAGKTFILGYTNEKNGIFKDGLPVIIFDDFTTATKFVNFPFKAKSSAMKILKPKNEDVNMKLVFEMMQTINYESDDHKRYWISEYQEIEIKLPSKQEQQKIAGVLTTADKEIKLLKEELESLKEQKKGLMQRLLTGIVRVRV